MANQDIRTTNNSLSFNRTVQRPQRIGKTNVGGGTGGAVPTQGEGPANSAILNLLSANFPIIGQIIADAARLDVLIQQIKQFLSVEGMPGELVVCFPASATPYDLSGLQRLGNLGARVLGNKKLRFVTGEGAAATVSFTGRAGQPSQMFRVAKDSSLLLSIGDGVTVDFNGAAGQVNAVVSLANPTRSSAAVQVAAEGVIQINSPAGARSALVGVNSTVAGQMISFALYGDGCEGDGEVFLDGAGDISVAVSDAVALADAQNVQGCFWNDVPLRVAGAGTTDAVARFTQIGRVFTEAAGRQISAVANYVQQLYASGSELTELAAAVIDFAEVSITSAVPLSGLITYDVAQYLKYVIAGGGSLAITSAMVSPSVGKQVTGGLNLVGAVTFTDSAAAGSYYDNVNLQGTAAYTQAGANPRAIINGLVADGAGNTVTQTAPGTLGLASVVAPAGPTVVGAPVIGQTVVV